MTTRILRREYSETVPAQYEDGFTIFMGTKIKVDARVLIPRPETELLVKIAERELRRSNPEKCRIIDMCTGSGAIAITLAKSLPQAHIKAVDISREALEVAEENIREERLFDNIDILVSDMFSCFGDADEGIYDGIVSNPPYVSDRDFELLDPWVKAEPPVALFAGKNGMDHLNTICSQSLRFLKSGGFLAVEIGYDQSLLVREKMKGTGFFGIESFKDDNGHDRVIIGRKNG